VPSNLNNFSTCSYSSTWNAICFEIIYNDNNRKKIMNTFENNLEALYTVNPDLAASLRAIKTNTIYEVFTDKDPANINLIDTRNNTPLYQTLPVEETFKKVEELIPYRQYPYLYFFGLGNGVIYKLLFQNEIHRRIVVFEPEIEIIYIVLNLIDFSHEIMEQKLVLLEANNITYNAMFRLFDNDAKIFAKVYDLLVILPYYEKYYEKIMEINASIVRAIEQLVYSFGNDVEDSLIGIQHFITNLPRLIQTPKLQEFLHKIKNTKTAVIVSTGPSLMKQLPLLKEVQEYVTIICIDASFPILAKHEIKPDVVVSMERIALTSTFYKNTPDEFHKDIVFAVSSIAHQELLESIHGGTLVLISRPFGYKFFFDFEEWGYLGRGMSAANLAYEIAAMALFNEIIFIGQDLSYGKNGNSHAADHVLGKDEVKNDKSIGAIEAYGGDGMVETTMVWKLFLNFFELDIAEVNQAGYSRSINATEGGARIHGTEEIPFKDIVETLVDKKEKKEKITLLQPDAKEIKFNQKKITSKINQAKKVGLSVKKSTEKVFLELAAFLNEVEELNKASQLEKINYKKVEKLIHKIDLIKEKVDHDVFNKVFFDLMQSYILHQELELATVQVRYVDNEEGRKAKLIEWLYAHKGWLFSVAGIIDAVLVAIERGEESQSKAA
jgi:hypothetical protein